MVLTRAGTDRLMLQSQNPDINMDNVPRTPAGSACATSVGSFTATPVAATTTTSMAPVVQQFMSLAQEPPVGSNDASRLNETITTPDYSSLTARNGHQEVRQSMARSRTPEPFENRNTGEEVVQAIREEFGRRIQQLQDQMQHEITHALQRWSIRPANPIPNNHPEPHQGFARAQPRDLPPANLQPAHGGQLPQGHGAHVPQHPAGQSTPPVFENSLPATHFSSPALDYGYRPQHKIDLSKWGIKFDGTTKSMSAEDFIFRVDVLRQDNDCSFHDIRRSFHLLLEGQALDWYWNLRKLAPIQTWEDLKIAFLTQFRRYESEFQLQKKIMDRRQMPQESFEDFYNAVMKLRNQQSSPYSERDLVEIMKSNLKPALSHLLFSVRVIGLQDFCQQAKRAENLLASQRQFQPRTMATQRLHEIAFDEEEMAGADFEVEALAATSKYICWNCRQKGHSFMDCPSPTRRIFCYKCGRDNVVTPKCPKCQGNLPSNKPHTGETRSTQT